MRRVISLVAFVLATLLWVPASTAGAAPPKASTKGIASGQGAQADLAVKGSVLGSRGAERTIRVTLVNLGPGEAYAGDDTDDFNTDFVLQLRLSGAELIETSIPCEDDPFVPPTGPSSGTKRCSLTSSVPVGQSRSFEVRLRVTNTSRFGSELSAVYGCACNFGSASSDPNLKNDGTEIDLSAGAGCTVKAKSPHRPTRRGLRLTLRAPPAAGCVVKVVEARVQIGRRMYPLWVRRLRRTLAPGTTRTLDLPFGRRALSAIRVARRAGRRVIVRGKLNVDGATRRVRATIR